jgi:ABC-type proline/glycine betaine transport system substrate-binding protein
MAKLTIGALFALVFLNPAAMAQDQKPVKPVVVASAAIKSESLDASIARLAMKAALQPSAQPTQEELLGLIVLMSLRQQRASGT